MTDEMLLQELAKRLNLQPIKNTTCKNCIYYDSKIEFCKNKDMIEEDIHPEDGLLFKHHHVVMNEYEAINCPYFCDQCTYYKRMYEEYKRKYEEELDENGKIKRAYITALR